MLLPKANKTSLVKLVRSKGYSVPSIYQAMFERHKRAFWLSWRDADNVAHTAYYSAAGGRPILLVDKAWHDLTMAEVIHFGLCEKIKTPPDAGTSDGASEQSSL